MKLFNQQKLSQLSLSMLC